MLSLDRSDRTGRFASNKRLWLPSVSEQEDIQMLVIVTGSGMLKCLLQARFRRSHFHHLAPQRIFSPRRIPRESLVQKLQLRRSSDEAQPERSTLTLW